MPIRIFHLYWFQASYSNRKITAETTTASTAANSLLLSAFVYLCIILIESLEKILAPNIFAPSWDTIALIGVMKISYKYALNMKKKSISSLNITRKLLIGPKLSDKLIVEEDAKVKMALLQFLQDAKDI